MQVLPALKGIFRTMYPKADAFNPRQVVDVSGMMQ